MESKNFPYFLIDPTFCVEELLKCLYLRATSNWDNCESRCFEEIEIPSEREDAHLCMLRHHKIYSYTLYA